MAAATDKRSSPADKIMAVRMPIYKNITESDIRDDYALFRLYTDEGITPSAVVTAVADPFVAAFIIQTRFSESRHLKALLNYGLDNATYNALKKHLADASKEDIDLITASRPAGAGQSECLDALRGELYRIRGIDLDADESVSAYCVLGYVTLSGVYLAGSGAVIGKYLGRFPELIEILDPGAEAVRGVFVKNIGVFLDRFIETGVVFRLLGDVQLEDALDAQPGAAASVAAERPAGALSPEQIGRILEAAGSGRRDGEVMEQFIERVKGMADLNRVARVVLSAAHDSVVFGHFGGWLTERMSRAMARLDGTTAAAYCYVQLYYQFIARRELVLSASPLFSLVADQIENDKKYNSISAIKMALIEIGDDFVPLARLFVHFIHFIGRCPFTLADILPLPERFFLAALDRKQSSASEGAAAAQLKRFHLNPLHDRIRRAAASGLDPDLFAKYLIARGIYYPINLTSYIGIMSPGYKLLYALHNLDWAASAISELRAIGLPRELYMALRKSDHRGVLTEADTLRHDEQLLVGYDKNELVGGRTRPIPDGLASDLRFAWAGSAQPVQSPVQPAGQAAASPPVHGLNTVLDGVMGAVKAGEDAAHLFDGVASPSDYIYVVRNVLDWIRGTRYTGAFSVTVEQTVGRYRLGYSDVSSILECLAPASASLLVQLASALPSAGLTSLISDHPKYASQIADGIILGCESSLRCSVPHIVSDLLQSTQDAVILTALLVCSRSGSVPPVDVTQFLDSKNDSVVAEAAALLEPGTHNEKLLEIIFSRGVIDDVCVSCFRSLDLSAVHDSFVRRIYALFYVEPLEYLKRELFQYGFAVDEHIVIELISALVDVYCPVLFGRATSLFRSFPFTRECYQAVIVRLDTTNDCFREWAIQKMAESPADNAKIQHIVKICQVLANEDSLHIVGLAIETLQTLLGKMTSASERRSVLCLFEEWIRHKKLSRLSLRVYPLSMADRPRYDRLFRSHPDPEEKQLLRDVYRL